MHHSDPDIASIATWEFQVKMEQKKFGGTVNRNDEAHCFFSDFSTVMGKG
jgi:hypothetical protein